MRANKRHLTGALLGLAGSLALLGVRFFVVGDPLPEDTEYPVTGFVLFNFDASVALGSILLGSAIAWGLQVRAWAVGAGFVAFMWAAISYELTRFPSSHNLLPFDIVGSVVYAAPLMLGAGAANVLRAHWGSRAGDSEG